MNNQFVQYTQLHSLLSEAVTWTEALYRVRVVSMEAHVMDPHGVYREYQIGAHVRVAGPEGVHNAYVPLRDSYVVQADLESHQRGEKWAVETDRLHNYLEAREQAEDWADFVAQHVAAVLEENTSNFAPPQFVVLRDGVITVPTQGLKRFTRAYAGGLLEEFLAAAEEVDNAD